MRVISAVRFNVRGLWVRAFAAMVVTGTSMSVLLAAGNACCAPEPGTNDCHAAGCADSAANSTCLGVVLTQIGQCCGTGDGTASCVRIRQGRPETAWCVHCNSGRTCGTCSTLPPEEEPPPPCDCQQSPSCCSACFGTWMDDSCNTGSPILINLERNGSDHLTSLERGVRFDLMARGVRDRTSWTTAGTRVAFLVLDRNGNGVIDDGTELFGTSTPLANGNVARNGFEALYDLDGGPGVSDWQIDSRDAVYNQLRLWVDANHNGVSEPQELQTLQEGGVTVIYTTYRETRRRDRFGNWYRYAGLAFVDREGGDTQRRIFDVFFKTSRE